MTAIYNATYNHQYDIETIVLIQKMKFDLLVTTALIPLLISTANPARAEKGDVLKILGGVAAGLAIGAAADQGNANEPAQLPIKQQSGSSNANIQWSDTTKPKAISKASKYDTDVKVVQEFMKIKGYYAGKVNGYTSPETIKALNDYEDAYGISRSKVIDTKSVDRLEQIALHYTCPEDYKAALKETKGNRDHLIDKHRDETNQLISDFQEYTKSNNSSIDPNAASKKIIDLKNAIKAPDYCFVTSFEEFQKYTDSVQGFSTFKEEQQKQRNNQEAVAKNNLKKELDVFNSFSDQYLMNHLGYEKAVNLKAALDKQPALQSVSLAQYSKYHADTKAMIESDHSIHSEYIAWNSKRLQNQVVKTTEPQKKSFWSMFSSKEDASKPADTNKDPLSTSRFKYEIIKTYETMIVGTNEFTESKASDSASYIVVEYSYKNISGKPIGAFRKPKVYLKDNNGQKYKADSHATSSYQFDQKTDLKLFSDVNPGVTIKTAGVFEIGRDIPKTGWTVVIEADEDIQLPLILNNQQVYKMDKAYQELPASQRKQIERVEEDPSKLWEALAEIDEEVKRQDSINNFYKQYR